MARALLVFICILSVIHTFVLTWVNAVISWLKLSDDAICLHVKATLASG